MHKLVLLVALLLAGLVSFCQEVSPAKAPALPRFSVRANVGIPKITSSEAFRNSFSGVITVDGNISCKIFSNFFVGAGYQYIYFKSQRYFRDLNINTNMQSQNGYVKVGYDKFFSARGFTTISLNAGYSYNQFGGLVYKNDSLKGKYPTQFTSGFVEPMVGIYFVVDPNFAIGGHLAYSYNFTQFDPAYPGFDKWMTFSKLRNNLNMGMITLGFGFYYGLARNK